MLQTRRATVEREKSGGFRGERRLLAAFAAATVSLLAACSGSSGPTRASETAATTTTTTAPRTVVRKPPPPIIVRVTTKVDDVKVSDEATLTPDTTRDPFGRFASCSGVRSRFGAYNLLLSHPDPAIGSVQITTRDYVRTVEITAATARIERGGEVLLVNGILDFGDSFGIGTFGGSAADGREIRIDFACESTPPAEPIDRTRQFVDVAMLLSKDGHERRLSLGVQGPCRDGEIDVLRNKARPYAQGSVSRVKITPDELTIGIGDRDVELVDFAVRQRDETSGTFTATAADGATITGAYSCRK